MFWALLAQACRKSLSVPGDFILAVNISPSQVRDQWFPEKVLRTLAGNRLSGAPLRDRSHRKRYDRRHSTRQDGADVAEEPRRENRARRFRHRLFVAVLAARAADRQIEDRPKLRRSPWSRIARTPPSSAPWWVWAKRWGSNVTAEGVEDVETADALRAVGCLLGQGYLFGKAIEMPIYASNT